MLKTLRIQNFKGWQDTGNIRLSPITLFFGANSSGKSSIGQFLMMLKQTVESSDRKTVFFPGDNNSAVQLGSFRDMVFHRDPESKISFEYSWTFPGKIQFKDPISNKSYSGNSFSFEAEVGLMGKKLNSLVLNQFKYEIHNKNQLELSIDMERKADTKSKYKVESINYELKREKGRVWLPGSPVRFYGFPDEVVAYYQNADFVQELNFRHEKFFRSLCYLGPIRTKAARLYSWGGNEPESVGYSGQHMVAAILSARERKIALMKPWAKRASPAKLFEEIIALKLKDMELIEDFKVNPISEQRQEYEVKVRTKGSKDWVDLPDVGFGISQVLPVLVQCFYAPPGSIILMEQPEIHLHPKAQSILADVMIDVINSRENGTNRNIQLIIETHSEHFLRRLQRRIAEDVIDKNDISAYFADITKSPATLKPLQIDLFGGIVNWPPNFFGDEMADITGQTEAAMRKRKQLLTDKREKKQNG